MPFTSFCTRHPLIALLLLSLFISGTAALAGTQIQADSVRAESLAQNNPHRIPRHMDPKSLSLAKEIDAIQFEAREEVTELGETIHAMAFQGRQGQSLPILDYTTGTSN